MKILIKKGIAIFMIPLLLMIGLFVGSANASDSEDILWLIQSATKPVTVDRTWTGLWFSDNGSTGSTSASLTQSGRTLGGSMNINNVGNCHGPYNGTITGSVSGHSVSFTSSGSACGAPVSGSFSGTVSGNTMSGTYTTYAYGVSYDSGTFSVTSQSVTFAGNWTGTWVNYSRTSSGGQSINITQQGAQLSGTMNLDNVGSCRATLKNISFTGSVSSSYASMSTVVTPVCQASGYLSLSNCAVVGNKMSGQWTTFANGLYNDSGTFTVNR